MSTPFAARTALGTVGVLVLGLGSSTLAETYLPLGIGSYWQYEHLQQIGRVANFEVTGQQTVIGAETAIVQREEWGQVTAEFFSTTPEGDVYYHGHINEAGPVAYDPPVLFFDAPPIVGSSWSTTFQKYLDFEGTIPEGDPMVATFQILSQAVISTPAGTFPAFELGTASGHTQAWFAADVGIVQLRNDWELVAFGGPVSIEAESWARVKAMYR